jgi:hypothetical protein
MNSGVSQTTREAPLVGGLQLAMAAAAAVAVISLLRLPLAPNLSSSLNPESKAVTIDAAAKLGLVDIEDPVAPPAASAERSLPAAEAAEAVSKSSEAPVSGPALEPMADQAAPMERLAGVESATRSPAEPVELTGLAATSNVTAPVQAVPSSKLRIVNHGPIAVGFAIDGSIHHLAPGESIERELASDCHLRYRCGGSHGIDSQMLSPGSYQFRVTLDHGWQLEPIATNAEGS